MVTQGILWFHGLDHAFVLSTLVVPLAALVTNYLLRTGFGVLISAGADLLLVLLVFDIAAMLSIESINGVIRSNVVRQDAIYVFSWLAIITAVSWTALVVLGERKLQSCCEFYGSKLVLDDRGRLMYFFVLAFVGFILMAHIFPFTWEE